MPVYHLDLYNIFYCDYFYQANGTKYSIHGAGSNAGYPCGIFCIALSYAINIGNWSVSASISFKK